MTPAALRSKVGLAQSLVAVRMGVSLQTLRILEATPLGAWSVEQVGRYAAACGRVLKVSVVADDGTEEDIQ